MKHLKALVCKSTIYLGYFVDYFNEESIMSVLWTLRSLGNNCSHDLRPRDLVILRKIGNIAATIADAGASALILWLYLTSMNYTTDLWMMVLVPAVLIGFSRMVLP